MKSWTGIPASQGIAIGTAALAPSDELELKQHIVDQAAVPAEQARLMEALDVAEQQLAALVQKLKSEGMENEAGIIEGQFMLLSDPELAAEVTAKIASDSVHAEWAVDEIFAEYAARFDTMDDAYLKERKHDILDARNRLVRILLGQSQTFLTDLQAPVIVVARDLTPSYTAQMNRAFVLGFATCTGSETSHTAILARTIGIPAIVGCPEPILAQLHSGDTLIVDGTDGTLIVNPDEKTLQAYRDKQAEYAENLRKFDDLIDTVALTEDGKRIRLTANIGSADDAPYVHKFGGEGVGLFRTEFVFMNRTSLPSEEEQLAVYERAVNGLAGKPLCIRTLDIGGDKALPYLNIPAELNPFLGYRAIRYCLAEQDVFLTQLRAILRAAASGPVSVMFPMISGLEELLAAKQLLVRAAEQLDAKAIKHGDVTAVGIMIETPAAAIISDILAPHVDFFSIGTNDLIQYTIAVDRMNERVSYLYNPQHVAILRLIRSVCEHARKHHVKVSMCGEMAGNPELTSLLVGLGVAELSMNPGQIPQVKANIIGICADEAEREALVIIQ